MTSEELQAIVQAAVEIAYSAADKQNPGRTDGYVSWRAIHNLRLSLQAAGIATDAPWKYPAEVYGLGIGWRLAGWDETARYGTPDAWGNREYAHALCDTPKCRTQARFIGPDDQMACDRHVPTRRPRP